VTFLNPAWLLLALAAAIPIVIHLLRRRIGTRVELPTARYLARAEAEHSRELRLRNLLLMLLRAGAIVLIAVAAARPFAPVPGGARAPGAIAIVVDNTMSSAAVSGGVPVLDELRAAARVPLERLTSSDRAWLITADGAVHSGTGEALLVRLDSIRPPRRARRSPARACPRGRSGAGKWTSGGDRARHRRTGVAVGRAAHLPSCTPGDLRPCVRAAIQSGGGGSDAGAVTMDWRRGSGEHRSHLSGFGAVQDHHRW
jgi:hypothetical protein